MPSLIYRQQAAAERAAQDHRINLEAASSFFHALLELKQDIPKSDASQLRHIMSALRHTPDPAVIPNTYRYDQLGLAARHLIDLWEQEPLYIGTKEHDRAKVRLVRDLLIQGKMDEAVERGILTVANHVREQAEIVTFVDENCEYVWHFPAPKVIKMKELRLEGFERTIDLKAQALVMEAEGRPQWRLDLEDRIKESQERNKTKQGRKEKNEKRNRRRMKLQKRRERRKAAKAGKWITILSTMERLLHVYTSIQKPTSNQ